ncbi:MAG: FUN14 domain-containing protein [Epsilonproteobacteria bacterium]|nr:FUN14 domain-containing protein [Campylobacterota bacterium]MBD3839307.1 FUN14 domain-containing protein [Campylobacterota bacterium]
MEDKALDNGGIGFLDLGTSFVIGLAVGFFLKKSIKMALFVLGFILVAMFLMESNGMLSVNETTLEHTVGGGIDLVQSLASFLKNRLDAMTFGKAGSAVAGFFVGLKIG